MAHCDKHGEYDPQQSTILGVTITTGCPGCVEENERYEAELIRRESEESLRSRLADMNIEPAFYDASLDNFDTPTQELEHNLKRVRELVEGKIQKVVMTGKNGTGKTHLACGALRILGGRIMSMYEISTTIRASYTALAQRTELEIVDELARLPLFVIDEIGRTKGGDVEANWLSYIVDKRHVRGLPLILISNKHTKKNCAQGGCSDCLENYIGEDIMSRLCEGGVLLKFGGDDYRKKPKEIQ